MKRVRPTAEVTAVVFYAFDDKGITEEEGRFGHFYGTIPIYLATKPQTLLVLEMNGGALPVEHGALVRLRRSRPGRLARRPAVLRKRDRNLRQWQEPETMLRNEHTRGARPGADDTAVLVAELLAGFRAKLLGGEAALSRRALPRWRPSGHRPRA